MKMKSVIGLAVALTVLMTDVIAAVDSLQNPYTLQQCIDLALKNNLQARQGQYASKEAQINLRQARINLIPSLDASFDHTYSQGRSIDPATNLYVEQRNSYGTQGLRTSATLFNGLSDLFSIRQRAAAFQAAQLDEQQVKDEITLDVVLTYVQVLTAKDMLEQAKKQLELTNEQVNRITLLQADGAIAPGDYYDLKGQLAADRNVLTDAVKAYNDTRISLCRLVNMPFGTNISLEPLSRIPVQMTVPEEQQLFQHASAKLGIIRAADWWKKNAAYGVRAAKSAYFPSLSVLAGLSSNYSGSVNIPYSAQMQNNLGRYVSISLQIPILSALTVRNNVAKARLALDNAAYVAETRRNELQQTTRQILLDLETAREKYGTLSDQVTAYAESFRIAEVRFNAGDINMVDFLIAKNKMDNANANLVIARYQWHLQQRIADYYNGSW